ncbi:helix-turn-helix domain-containing protein [Brevibacillus sp. NRS-1366]|uniref:helix-turn-helix domain-containing protein n=1 Tax=Brevibacillus sp. NRS-1366 TaxID=3233899 RepID=UPI003D229C20
MLEEYNEFLTVDDLQKALGIGKAYAYQLVNSGQFKVIRVGRLIKVPKKSLLVWMYGDNYEEKNHKEEKKEKSKMVPDGSLILTDKEDILFFERIATLPLKKKQKLYRVIYDLLDLSE